MDGLPRSNFVGRQRCLRTSNPRRAHRHSCRRQLVSHRLRPRFLLHRSCLVQLILGVQTARIALETGYGFARGWRNQGWRHLEITLWLCPEHGVRATRGITSELKVFKRLARRERLLLFFSGREIIIPRPGRLLQLGVNHIVYAFNFMQLRR